jgi:hypothetical protein
MTVTHGMVDGWLGVFQEGWKAYMKELRGSGRVCEAVAGLGGKQEVTKTWVWDVKGKKLIWGA